jgi:hypothetical protein
MNAPDITMTGPQARAVAIAFAEFARTGADVARHEVMVVTHADVYEIIFLPEQAPGGRIRGGKTEAGRETHFRVSRQDFSLLRTHYAR